MEGRDITSAELKGKEVHFKTNINPIFNNKYKGVVKSNYLKKETLIFETDQDAVNYFLLTIEELRNEQ